MAQQSIEEIASRMVEELLTYEPGSWETTARLYESLFGPIDDSIDLFDLDCELENASKQAGLYLDTSSRIDSLKGLPYNLPFQVMRIAPDSPTS